MSLSFQLPRWHGCDLIPSLSLSSNSACLSASLCMSLHISKHLHRKVTCGTSSARSWLASAQGRSLEAPRSLDHAKGLTHTHVLAASTRLAREHLDKLTPCFQLLLSRRNLANCCNEKACMSCISFSLAPDIKSAHTFS